MITWTGARWHPQFNVFTLRCDCGVGWEAWARYALVQCPSCGDKAWLHENERGWDETIPLVTKPSAGALH